MKILTWLLDLLFPPKCVFCQKLLQERETDLCGKCSASLITIEGSIKRGTSYRRCWAVYTYEGHTAASIRRYKFHGMSRYAAAYGRQLAMTLLRNRVEFDVLTWVPISKNRLKARGYDQSQLLAEAVAQELGTTCIRTLEKIHDNAPQSTRKDIHARQGNVKGVYSVYRPERFAGKRVLIIDDVITTGATLTECSSMLKLGGAAEIEAAVLAATVFYDTK